MAGEPRMTLQTQIILELFLHDPERELYGLQICEEAGLATGTIHPILARLERVGWLKSRWEQIDPRVEGRRPRRYYEINPNSIAKIQAALARAQQKAPALRLRPGFTVGH
jgi:PadR family transcriptional regulator PadR